jgi:ABC-type dipeptide/oligopeptide/nickel transport system permease component
MLKYIVRRILWTVPVILLVILMTFAMMRLIKGNPVQDDR